MKRLYAFVMVLGYSRMMYLEKFNKNAETIEISTFLGYLIVTHLGNAG